MVQQVNPNIIVKRARFSVVQDKEIKTAWNQLVELDYQQAAAVDARSELDLRIGACFTRFQTLSLKDKFPSLKDVKVISYGSCQFPTLGFVVDQTLNVKKLIFFKSLKQILCFFVFFNEDKHSFLVQNKKNNNSLIEEWGFIV